jgi:hypothetical protein
MRNGESIGPSPGLPRGGVLALGGQRFAFALPLDAHMSTRPKTVAWSTVAVAVSLDPPDGTARHVRMTSGVSLSSVPQHGRRTPCPAMAFGQRSS